METTREERLEASTRLLNEIDRFMQRYLHLTPNQRHAMLLYATATHAGQVLPAFPHMAWIAPQKGTGKTTCMKVTAALSASPVPAKATTDGLMSALVLITKTTGFATLWYDEIGKFYGDMGTREPSHIMNDVLLEGYKAGAERTRSTRQQPEKASLYHAFLMTGRHISMPDDVADRTIFIRPEQGQGLRFFDVRVAQPRAQQYSAALASAVGMAMDEIEDFRGFGIHPALVGRELELWEPLFAVAVTMGGQEWLNYCLEAFKDLELNSASRRVLSAREQMLSDISELLDGELSWMEATEPGFAPGSLLADALKATDRKMYRNMLPEALLLDLSDTLDLPKYQVRGLKTRDDRYPFDRMRGYYTEDLREAWALVQPEDPDDAVLPEFEDPFGIEDSDEEVDLSSNTVTETAQTAQTARPAQASKTEPVMSLVDPPCNEDTDKYSNLPAVERRFLKEEALA